MNLEGLDYGEYVDMISLNSYNARKASKDCVTLFHCLLLKEHGPRVFEALIYDIEGNFSVNIYVKELNLDLVLNFREDSRIDSGLFNDEEMSLQVQFKKPYALPNQPEEQEGMNLQVFDKVKIKLFSSETFPLEIKTKMLMTREDAAEFEEVLETQQKKQIELD